MTNLFDGVREYDDLSDKIQSYNVNSFPERHRYMIVAALKSVYDRIHLCFFNQGLLLK
jgi:hypothetical protein